jgi:NADPH2:quinone reductase
MGAIPELTELLAEGVLAVQVGETFPLEAAADAHEHIESRQSTGKVVVVP